jgi:hypothetical protein
MHQVSHAAVPRFFAVCATNRSQNEWKKCWADEWCFAEVVALPRRWLGRQMDVIAFKAEEIGHHIRSITRKDELSFFRFGGRGTAIS